MGKRRRRWSARVQRGLTGTVLVLSMAPWHHGQRRTGKPIPGRCAPTAATALTAPSHSPRPALACSFVPGTLPPTPPSPRSGLPRYLLQVPPTGGPTAAPSLPLTHSLAQLTHPSHLQVADISPHPPSIFSSPSLSFLFTSPSSVVLFFLGYGSLAGDPTYAKYSPSVSLLRPVS